MVLWEIAGQITTGQDLPVSRQCHIESTLQSQDLQLATSEGVSGWIESRAGNSCELNRIRQVRDRLHLQNPGMLTDIPLRFRLIALSTMSSAFGPEGLVVSF